MARPVRRSAAKADRSRQAAWTPTLDAAVPEPGRDEKRGGKVRPADLLWFAEQLRTTEEAGVPIYRALGMLAKMRSGTPFGARLAQLQRSIADGSTLSGAMAENPQVWNPTVVALISAGESSGSFAASFTRAAELLESRLRLRRKLRTALTYPAAVLSVATILILVLLFAIVPRFEAMYDSIDGELPGVTKAVIRLSDNAATIGLVFVALIGSFVTVMLRSRSDRALRGRRDRLRIRLPLVGSLMAKGIQARVASTLSSMLAAGVPLVEALDFAGATSGSVPHADDLIRVRRAITDGRPLAASLAESDLWPEAMIQLIEVGEETGRVTTTMELYAERARDEVETSAAALTTLIEPLMMVVIGAIVGVFLLALYLPIINLGDSIG